MLNLTISALHVCYYSQFQGKTNVKHLKPIVELWIISVFSYKSLVDYKTVTSPSKITTYM